MPDKIQRRLEHMEKESKSPSAAHAGGSRLPLWRRMLGTALIKKVSDHHQKPDEVALKPTDNLSIERERNSSMYNEETRNIREGRKYLGILSKNLKKESPLPRGSNDRNLRETLNQMKDSYASKGMEFDGTMYERHFSPKLKKGLEDSKNELERYIISNEAPFTEEGLNWRLGRTHQWAKMDGIDMDTSDIRRNAYETYASHARTVPISEVESEAKVKVVAALPMGGYHDRRRIYVNNPALVDAIGNRIEAMKSTDFFNLIQKSKPMIAGSIVKENDPHIEKRFFGPVGIILADGKIYNAGGGDIVSKTHGRVRVSLGGGSGDIRERIGSAVEYSHRNGQRTDWNEVHVGSYEIGGLYFIDDKNRFEGGAAGFKEEVARIARLAEDRGLPLYSVKTGAGFTQVNPRNYIKPGLGRLESRFLFMSIAAFIVSVVSSTYSMTGNVVAIISMSPKLLGILTFGLGTIFILLAFKHKR